METKDVEIISAPSVRRLLTTPGDIRSDIDFQNDINYLLARIEDLQQPWKAAARLMSFGVADAPVAQRRRNNATTPLRVFDGGVESGRALAQAPQAAEELAAPLRLRRGA